MNIIGRHALIPKFNITPDLMIAGFRAGYTNRALGQIFNISELSIRATRTELNAKNQIESMKGYVQFDARIDGEELAMVKSHVNDKTDEQFNLRYIKTLRYSRKTPARMKALWKRREAILAFEDVLKNAEEMKAAESNKAARKAIAQSLKPRVDTLKADAVQKSSEEYLSALVNLQELQNRQMQELMNKVDTLTAAFNEDIQVRKLQTARIDAIFCNNAKAAGEREKIFTEKTESVPAQRITRTPVSQNRIPIKA